MFDLKKRVESIINIESESNKALLLEHDWSDSIASHGRQIIESLAEYHGLEIEYKSDLYHAVLDWISFNQESCIEYVNAGFPYISDNEYFIETVGEIEIDLSHWFGKPLSDMKRDAINSYTDLYVTDGGEYGYFVMGYDFIAINMDRVDFNEINNAL